MKKLNVIFLVLLSIAFFACSQAEKAETMPEKQDTQAAESKAIASEALVTFYELGSTTCIPCKQMKPVMEAIEKKFGSQINVVFIDINKEKEKSKEFGIQLIPTQVFHDKDGKEIHRHVGFYPEEEITNFLIEHGLSLVGSGE